MSPNAKNLLTPANANALALLRRLPVAWSRTTPLSTRDRFDACRMAQAGLCTLTRNGVTITDDGRTVLAEVTP